MSISVKPRLVHQHGFTLIEMLVTIGIGLLLAGLGIAGYIGFNDKQKILGSAREMESIFQTAATKAQSGDLNNCAQLASYRVTFVTTTDPVTANLSSVCQDGTITVNKSYELGNGVGLSFSPSITAIDFPVLQGGVIFTPSTANVTATFTNTAITSRYAVVISRGGDVNEGVWE